MLAGIDINDVRSDEVGTAIPLSVWASNEGQPYGQRDGCAYLNNSFLADATMPAD